MNRNGVVRSTCAGCFTGCGILVHLEDGKITKIQGDPDAIVNKGLLCPKGEATLELLHHPDRLSFPLERAGERGEGKWKRISWEKALSTIADKMLKARDQYGAESVAFLRGVARGIQDGLLARLANAFGTPNLTSQGFVCFHPARYAAMITMGVKLTADWDYPPACMVIWGSNPPETSAVWRYPKILEALNKGSKLVVVDPRKTFLAEKADQWLRLRPGTDTALALSMLHVILNENLYDRLFVDKWTVGFDRLEAHVQKYSPEEMEEITWVPAGKIREAARLYAANKPGVIVAGNALEQNINSFQADRAICVLQAISGNVGVPGGEIQWSPPPVLRRGGPEFTLKEKMPKEMIDRRLGVGLMAPFATYALPQIVQKGLIEGKPYPIRVAYVHGGNLMLTWANAQDTNRALKELPFLVVADLFMSPTASLADIVLPVASYLEFDAIRQTENFPAEIRVGQKVADPGERWPDSKIIIELAKKLGLREHFWGTYEELMEDILRPAGLTFEELRNLVSILGSKQYRFFERNGFNTPSKKIEIFSDRLDEWGFDPLPTYHELPETPYSEPDLAKEYPLIFTTWKAGDFIHSQYRQIASLRDCHPEPFVSIHPETADKLGIREGDIVHIETKRGRIKQKAALVDSIDPRLVIIDHDWWFPEKGAGELFDWATANTNILTDNHPPYSPEMGSTNLRGIACKVYKA
jgi:anaerobic selenocysteine-containing dehydrogenase